MKVDNLNDTATKALAKNIAEYLLKESDADDLRIVLSGICELFDDLSQDDFFGTEGWEHRLGVG